MDKDESADVAEAIRAEISRLKTEALRLKEEIAPIEPDRAIGRLSRLDAVQAQSIKEASLRKLSLRIEGLSKAEKRVGSEDFGLCVECGEQIPLARLLILPEATLCVACKE